MIGTIRYVIEEYKDSKGRTFNILEDFAARVQKGSVQKYNYIHALNQRNCLALPRISLLFSTTLGVALFFSGIARGY